MLPSRSNALTELTPQRALLVLATVWLIAGCAATGRHGPPEDPATEPAVAAKDRARLDVDGELGFTVTEVVRISGDVRADYQDALALLQNEQYDAGIALLSEVTVRAPGLTAPHIDLGVAYRLSGDYEQAERSLSTALELAPNHPVVLNELGILYRRTGRFDAARQSYEQALALHPGFHFARRNLGVLCDLFLQDLACALEQYEAYREIVPDDEVVEMWIADIRNRSNVTQ